MNDLMNGRAKQRLNGTALDAEKNMTFDSGFCRYEYKCVSFPAATVRDAVTEFHSDKVFVDERCDRVFSLE
jgi:hypothetical protein